MSDRLATIRPALTTIGQAGVALLCALMIGDRVATQPAPAQGGRLIVYLISHAIGEERFELVPSTEGLTLATTMEYADRGTTRRSAATLRMASDYTPIALEVEGPSKSTASVRDGSATVDNGVSSRRYSFVSSRRGARARPTHSAAIARRRR
jgi:hypothetical protein